MLSEKVNTALNRQIEMEAYASAYYLAMASWCEQKGFQGSAEFFYKQSDEERAHMLKIFRFVNEAEGQAISPGVKQPPADFDSFKALFETALAQEREVTTAIYDLMKIARDKNDFATQNLMQWFVDEQLEEEKQIIVILDKLKLIGDAGVGLFMLDNELGQKAAQGSGG